LLGISRGQIEKPRVIHHTRSHHADIGGSVAGGRLFSFR